MMISVPSEVPSELDLINILTTSDGDQLSLEHRYESLVEHTLYTWDFVFLSSEPQRSCI